ncbi:kyphoscoliosis peptidase [Xenopus laevis]|uniref:Kyphoscoliosis peptidase n=1 Tax=Xenopus laevis TaxID=8355 RepID=A0A8J0V9F5_XENLA|nr:kyphoscoliosis peptidase [Xenopus laevis]
MDIRQDSSSLRIDLLLIVHSQDKQTGGDKSEEPVPPRQAVKPAPRKPHTSGQIISSYESQESHVRLEIHPKTSKPQLLNRPTVTGAPLSTNNGNSWDPTPQPSAKDFYAYPWDKSNLKSLAMNLKNFEKLDAYSVKVGKPSTVEQLVSSLLKMARTDLEKVRAIWTWICHHIEYDLDGMEDKSKRSGDPNQTLLTGKGACEGYAGLFENMCSRAGIQCLKIGGYSKGFCYKTGHTFSEEPNHAWNAVYLNKRWHLVDTTWGAGFANSSTNSFKFRYNEFYFLTHPALFIAEHFPDNQNWQLLQVPLSMKQFEGNLCRNSNFYNAGLTTSYPETLMVETVNGKATFSIEGHSPALFSFTLNKTEKPGIMTLTKNGMQLDVYPTVTGRHKLELYTKPFNPGKESYDKVVEYILHCGSVDTGFRIPKELEPIVGPSWLTEIKGFLQNLCSNPIISTQDGCCSVGFTLVKKATVLATLHSDNIKPGDENRYVLQTLRGNRVEFKVHLPQKGFYALKIHSSCGPLTFECFCNYLVVCTNPEVAWPPFPRQLQNPVGPTALMEKRGLLQPSQRDPIIYTSSSHCSLSFTLKEDIKILTSLLFDETPLTDHGGKRLVIQAQKGNHVEIQIHLPQAGAYILQIFANSKTSPTSFEYVCNYLICCSNKEAESPEGLVTAQSTLNSANTVDKNGFMRPSQQGQVIESPDGRCSLSFSLDREESCLATLHCDDSKWNKQMERRYIMYTQKHRHVEFYIQLPKSGSYELRIYVDNRSQPGSYEFVSGYLITCNNPDVAWPPFPNKLQNPVGPTALSEKKGLLQPSHTNPIIDSTEGRCSFSFTLKKEMGIFARLQSDDVNLTEEAERRHVLQVQRQNKVEFQVQLPQCGMYVLKIYTESEQGSYKFACNYLINCTNTKVTWPLLPVELSNPVGPSSFSEKKGLVRPSVLEPVIYTDDGCCSVSFGLNDSIDVVATLHADDITSEEVRRRHVFQVIKDGYVEFLTRLPKAGTYVLKICTKTKSDPGNMYDYTCNYLLCCSNPNVRWPFFPMRYNAWDCTYELLEPLNGILPANSPVQFKIKARGLAAVLVKGLNLCPLTLNSDGCWEGTCNTQGCQDIHVMLTNNLNKNYALVLSYKVNNTDSQGS